MEEIQVRRQHEGSCSAGAIPALLFGKILPKNFDFQSFMFLQGRWKKSWPFLKQPIQTQGHLFLWVKGYLALHKVGNSGPTM